jgi:hypothetical protein
MSMPGVRGFSGLLFLRTQYPAVPVVVVSAHEESEGVPGGLPHHMPRLLVAVDPAAQVGVTEQADRIVPERVHPSERVGEEGRTHRGREGLI